MIENDKREDPFKGFHKIVLDPGNTVLCDYCNRDYTDSAEQGGFLFGSKAICPKCAPDAEASIRRYKEEGFIRGFCPKGVSFADWVRSLREPKP